MNGRPPPELLGRRFRLNPVFRVVAIGQLTEGELKRLGGVRNDAEIAAVLMPQVPSLSVKAICGNTANLLESFRLSSNPSGVVATPSDRGLDSGLLVRLVLDSVLEIEHEGQFLSGVAAAEVLELAPIDDAIDGRASARISREALHYAEALRISDPLVLSAKLYFYNRVPISPRWTKRMGTDERLSSWMQLRPEIILGWNETSPPPDNLGWKHFRLEGHRRTGPFKLYVNPRLDVLGEAIEAALPILSGNGFAAFKLGRHLQGLLRPDKFVAYASSREQIDRAAEALLPKLRGMPAQAVPFTAAIDEGGLLSWGVDPPRSERVSVWQGTSWRRWITDKLAVALIGARAGGAPAPSRFALQRLALEGVDVNTWTPKSAMWDQAI